MRIFLKIIPYSIRHFGFAEGRNSEDNKAKKYIGIYGEIASLPRKKLIKNSRNEKMGWDFLEIEAE